MQTIVDAWHWLLGGGGLLSLVGSIVTLRTWGRRLKLAETTLTEKMHADIGALRVEITQAREELAACRQRDADHARQLAARDRAMDMLVAEIERRTTPPRRR